MDNKGGLWDRKTLRQIAFDELQNECIYALKCDFISSSFSFPLKQLHSSEKQGAALGKLETNLNLC